MSRSVKLTGGRPPRRDAAHVRIEAYLRELIAQGHGIDAALPSEQVVADRFGVSRMTARVAFQTLATSGVIVRYPARGSFVAPLVVEDLTDWGRHSFYGRWGGQGLDVELRILTYDVREATDELGKEFQLPSGARLTYLERLRVTRGVPVTLDRMFMPESIHSLFDEHAFTTASVVALFHCKGIVLSTGETEIVGRPAAPNEAAPLGVRPGDIVLARRTVDRGAGGEVMIAETSVYPAARVSYRVRTTFSPNPDQDGEEDASSWGPRA